MWAAPARQPSSQEEGAGGWAQGKVLAHLPLQRGAWAGCQLTRSCSTEQMFLVRKFLAFNKLNYSKCIIRQGKHGHLPRCYIHTHTPLMLWQHRPFVVSCRSTPGEEAVSLLLELPITFHPTLEEGFFFLTFLPTHMLTIDVVIHASQV